MSGQLISICCFLHSLRRSIFGTDYRLVRSSVSKTPSLPLHRQCSDFYSLVPSKAIYQRQQPSSLLFSKLYKTNYSQLNLPLKGCLSLASTHLHYELEAYLRSHWRRACGRLKRKQSLYIGNYCGNVFSQLGLMKRQKKNHKGCHHQTEVIGRWSGK